MDGCIREFSINFNWYFAALCWTCFIKCCIWLSPDDAIIWPGIQGLLYFYRFKWHWNLQTQQLEQLLPNFWPKPLQLQGTGLTAWYEVEGEGSFWRVISDIISTDTSDGDAAATYATIIIETNGNYLFHTWHSLLKLYKTYVKRSPN